jgi:predicted nucleic acid-binding protein
MYLLDTNVVIDFCNSRLTQNAKDLLEGIEPSISVITSIELFASSKITEKEKSALEDFVRISRVYNSIDNSIVATTVSIRKLHKTKLPDAIIAATALVYNLTLISGNSADFKNIFELKVIDPYNLPKSY